MTVRFTIVGIGEALFDVFPDRQVLGGAPLNCAVHAHQLAQPLGGRGIVVSRIGQDPLGDQLLAEVRARGMTTDYIQTDPDRPTGTVYVDLSDPASPSYDIVQPVAWDWMQFDPDIESLAAQASAVCFGTLAQRASESRSAILRFLTAARRAVRLFDVNLRQQFYSAQIIRRSLEHATAVKINEEELAIIADLLALDITSETPGQSQAEKQAAVLLKKFNQKLVILTRGERGTLLITPTGRIEGKPAHYEMEEGADAVGAGDACAAAILLGLVMRWPLQRTADLANQIGAYVATRRGATPALPDEILNSVK
ncbi:MAG: carbohydrate kinase [Phycisphaeraceae bacterium]